MKKIVISFCLIIMLIASILVLSGCKKNEDNNNNNNPLVGSWDYSGYVYTFNDDKTGSYTAFGNVMDFTYEDDGSKVKIIYKGNTVPGTYEYKIDGNKLIIKDSFGSDVVYEKK